METFSTLYFDFVNQTYTDDIQISTPYAFYIGSLGYYLSIYPSVSGSGAGVATYGGTPAFLFEGDTIGNTFTYGGIGTLTFPINLQTYMGVAFKIDEEIHYGWALFEITPSVVILYSFAYETDPGKAIQAGAIPEASDMALMAGITAGSVAAFAARRRRKAAA